MKKFLLAASVIGLMLSATAQKAEVLTEKQVSKLDVSGKWVGKRHQFTDDQKGIQQSFEYEFNLKQEGNIITGTTNIVGTKGDYGDIKIRGVLVGNKLIFEEYEVASQHHNDPFRTWCFKAGELSFAKEGENVKMIGATSSFIPHYNVPCSGGYTEVAKVNEGGTAIDLGSTLNNGGINLDGFNVNVFPNPFVDKANINFRLEKDAKVQLQITDMQGKVVADLQNGKLTEGTHSFNFDAAKYPVSAGNLIVSLKVNGETHSKLLAKYNY